MTIKLIAADMDGTFLDERGTYDRPQFERILDTLEERGIRFVAASGNNSQRLGRIFSGLEQRVAFVAENGAHLVEGGKTLLRRSLAQSDIAQFLDFFGDRLAAYKTVVSGRAGTYILRSTDFGGQPDMIQEEDFKAFFSQMTELDDFSQIPATEAVSKMSMLAPDGFDRILADFNANFPGNMVAVSSGYGALDFIQKGIHKAWGLEQLMDRHGLAPDQVMVFGDSDNDLEMLALTPHSYAMVNASEQVKAAARHLAPSHRDNGVLRVIEAHLQQR